MAPRLPASLRYVILGTTGTCNASCVHCPTGKSVTSHVPRTTMPMTLYENIIDGIVSLNLPVTNLFGFGLFGDALVDPLVVARATYLRARIPDSKLVINTNGAAFNIEKHSPLRDLVHAISLHCESLDPVTYDELMQPLRAERVFPKYEQILEQFPGKVMVSVPLSNRNIREVSTIRDWFVARGARGIAPAALFSRCAEDRSVFNALAPKPVVRVRCTPEVARDLIVDCDGQVLICCQDFERRECIGHIGENGLTAALLDFRRQHVREVMEQRRHNEMATCSRCYVGASV